MLGSVLDVLFPSRCLGCGGGGWPFCRRCLPGVAALGPPGCDRCGRPFDRPVASCPDCPPEPIAWSRSGLLYEGPVRRALMRLKFAGLRSATAGMAPRMTEALRGWPPVPPDPTARDRGPPDVSPVVTWVPLGRRRRRERGYDQAEVLAHAVAAGLAWPLHGLLERVRETAPQARRTGADRLLALSGAFRARAGVAAGVPVVLVDDVLTSGATAAECARVLRSVGSGPVGVLTAARSLGGPLPARCYTRPELAPGRVPAVRAVAPRARTEETWTSS